MEMLVGKDAQIAAARVRAEKMQASEDYPAFLAALPTFKFRKPVGVLERGEVVTRMDTVTKAGIEYVFAFEKGVDRVTGAPEWRVVTVDGQHHRFPVAEKPSKADKAGA